jgi:hypothetical protein
MVKRQEDFFLRIEAQLQAILARQAPGDPGPAPFPVDKSRGPSLVYQDSDGSSSAGSADGGPCSYAALDGLLVASGFTPRKRDAEAKPQAAAAVAATAVGRSGGADPVAGDARAAVEGGRNAAEPDGISLSTEPGANRALPGSEGPSEGAGGIRPDGGGEPAGCVRLSPEEAAALGGSRSAAPPALAGPGGGGRGAAVTSDLVFPLLLCGLPVDPKGWRFG